VAQMRRLSLESLTLITQSEKFDKQGEYIRRYVPELAAYASQIYPCPLAGAGRSLVAAGVEIGTDYPAPIMDIKESRERALAAFALTKNTCLRQTIKNPHQAFLFRAKD